MAFLSSKTRFQQSACSVCSSEWHIQLPFWVLPHCSNISYHSQQAPCIVLFQYHFCIFNGDLSVECCLLRETRVFNSSTLFDSGKTVILHLFQMLKHSVFVYINESLVPIISEEPQSPALPKTSPISDSCHSAVYIYDIYLFLKNTAEGCWSRLIPHLWGRLMVFIQFIFFTLCTLIHKDADTQLVLCFTPHWLSTETSHSYSSPRERSNHFRVHNSFKTLHTPSQLSTGVKLHSSNKDHTNWKIENNAQQDPLQQMEAIMFCCSRGHQAAAQISSNSDQITSVSQWMWRKLVNLLLGRIIMQVIHVHFRWKPNVPSVGKVAVCY